jgi:hypothetical protein
MLPAAYARAVKREPQAFLKLYGAKLIFFVELQVIVTFKKS